MRKPKHFHPDSPLLFSDHQKPMTRRDFIASGLQNGGVALGGLSLFSMFAAPNKAQAALSSDIEALKQSCGLKSQGAGKIPFIAFDLAGGANIAGSNVLVGGLGGQLSLIHI